MLSTFLYEPEFLELKEAGLVVGDICHPPQESDPDFAEKMAIHFPGITIAGAIKLAELEDYLHRNSWQGKLFYGFDRLAWLATGTLLTSLQRLFI